MNWDSVIGYLAALCSVASYTPQAWKIIKTRDTGSISAPMYAINVVGFALWLAFGILKNEWSLIITNVLILALSAFILVMTLLPYAKKDAVADALDVTSSGTQPSASRPNASDPEEGRPK
ncbi:SemiSWEET family sugar transporter [Mesorhizobium abyssinicae]|uniref:SemiSWEET family sugar transporter n=1 Tax=Mesorhizobium abyssinicae TaxID=1209958 RepID=UPI00339574F3